MKEIPRLKKIYTEELAPKLRERFGFENVNQIPKLVKIVTDKNRAIVEGVNFVKKHTKPSQKNPQGGIVEKEAPIHASNLRLVCPGCGESAGVSRKRDADGKARRICKSCGETV
jgi:large subunit ribosomal protein L24